MRIVTRPIEQWPGRLLTDSERKDSPFEAGWTDTVALLEREARHLGANEIVLQLALTEDQIRLDGRPYASATTRHPGVIVSIEGDQGPLSFPCDRFRERHYRSKLSCWQVNVRAVALAMEALRRVDRYGITSHGEQYAGWKALGSGTPLPAAQMTADDALEVLRFGADWPTGPDWDDPAQIHDAYRAAAKAHHPDVGGDPDTFRRITEARDLLLLLGASR